MRLIDKINRIIKKKPKAWIAVHNGNGWNDWLDITCPYCFKTYWKGSETIGEANYCPNCGRRVGRTNDENQI